MPETLEDIIRRKIREGLSAIQIQKWLRDNNMPVPWLEVKKIFSSIIGGA